jgi:coenzyme F420-reducing hydrogenase delta subunit
VTIPAGRTGVRATPTSCAAKVTVVLTVVELDGDADTLIVAGRAETACGKVEETLVL